MLNLIKKSKKLIIKGALKLKVFLVLFSLFFSSLALAEPTFIANFNVQDKETSPTGITFNPDGTKMFITGINMRKILQYNLTTAFDVTSAAFEKSVLIQVEQDKPQDVKFNSDGTVIFLLGTGTGVIDGVDAARNGIHRWSLSTPYDIGSITPANTTFTEVGGDNPRGLAFNNDGTKMFILDNTAQRVEEYNLSTPYNPDTKGSVANTLGNARSASHQGLGFNNDGSKIFIVKQDNKIDEYALSTAFDLSSATLTGTVSPTFPVTNKRISGFAFIVLDKMYHLDGIQC